MPLPKPMVQGTTGNTPNEAAINNANASNSLQASLNNLMGGFVYSRKLKHKKKYKYKGKSTKVKLGGGTLEVPLIDTPYTPVGAGGQTPNGISSSVFQSSNQGEANAQYDNLVGAGKRRHHKTQKKKKKTGKKRKTKKKNEKKRKTKKNSSHKKSKSFKFYIMN
jgi:hypothetical protein